VSQCPFSILASCGREIFSSLLLTLLPQKQKQYGKLSISGILSHSSKFETFIIAGIPVVKDVMAKKNN
jgi:hypothetical protein